MAKIAILGAGVMGTALAVPLCQNGHEVNIWGTELDTEVIQAMLKTGKSIRLQVALPNHVIPFPASQLAAACKDREIIVLAVTSVSIRSITRRLAPLLREGVILVNVAKGLETDHRSGRVLTLLEVIEGELLGTLRSKTLVVTIGGPSIARELARGVPTEVVFASKSRTAVKLCQRVFATPFYRVNISRDVTGVEVCAALKNVFAIAAGICDAFRKGTGLNTEINNLKAALVCEGIVELSKITKAMGGRVSTVLGPAGVGDLYVTVQAGRTRMFGEMLGNGMSPEEALKEMQKRNQVVEAYHTTREAYELVQTLEKEGKLNVGRDLPLLTRIYAVLYGGKTVQAVVRDYFATK